MLGVVVAEAEIVYLGLGSNLDARRNLAFSLAELEEAFGPVRRSPLYRSAAVGFVGNDFLNACCSIRCRLEPAELKAWLTALEDRHGRKRDLPKFADRTLDIDILLFGDRVGDFGGTRTGIGGALELPRDEILKYAHVLKPLADLAAEVVHPQTGKTIAEHWREFKGDNTLETVAW